MRRALKLVALVSAAALALASAWAYAERAEITRRLLLAQLEARGISNASLRVERVDRHSLALRDIAIGEPDAPNLRVASADLDFSIAGLHAGRLDALRVAGLRLHGRLDEGGLELGALDPLFDDDSESNATRAPLLLPAPLIALHDAELVFATPQGVALCAIDGQLASKPDGAIAGTFNMTLEHPLARAVGTVALSGTLEQLAAEFVLALRDGRVPARVAPATLRGHVSGAIHALEFDLALDGADGRLKIVARGSGDPVARTGKAELRLAPLVFTPKGLQPATLLLALEPLLAGLGIARVTGSVEARGTLALAEGTPALKLDLALRELGFDAPFARVSGIAGTIALRAPELRSLSDVHSPKGQLLSVALLDPGIALTEGLVDFQLLRDGAIALRSTSWKWAGGELRAENLQLDFAAERTPVLLQAHDLDLSALVAQVAVDGIEATGRISGELPLVLTGSELLVTNGLLRATDAGGTIRYRPNASTRALADSRPNDLGIAVSAFSDFRYHELEARIDGDVRGELRIALHVKGGNPGFQDNHPIELNLNLEARLLDLVRASVEAYRVPEAVEKRLRSFTEKEKK